MVGLLPLANALYAFGTSNVSGKAIVIILVGASIFAWAVMVTKAMELRHAASESRRFLAAFRRENHPLALFLKRADFAGSPLFRVYQSGCNAFGIEIEARGGETELFHEDLGRNIRLSVLQTGAIRAAAERQMADQALVLESKMGFLATAVSASPMLGLLGTVWGVMNAFTGMAVKGMANLSAVAPGIAGALLTTVVGLLVAIPSAIGYNYLGSRIRHLSVQMDNFADELLAEIQRLYIRE